MAEGDDISEERVNDRRLLGTSLLKNLANSEKFKKFTTAVKERLTSDNQRATNKLFASLKVGEAKENIFESSAFKEWIKRVTKNYKRDPQKGEVAMFFSLAAHYDDAALAKLLFQAQQSPKTRTMAKKFEVMQLYNWITQERTSDDVFNLLKLKADDKNLFKNPLLKTWISYAIELKDDAYDALYLKLTKHYDDYALARMLISAKDDANPIVRKVEQAQFKSWLADGKTADGAFNILKLNAEKGDGLLENPALSTWITYVTQLGKDDPYHMLLLKLTRHYSDDELANVLLTAKAGGGTYRIAGKLEQDQLKSWVRDGKTADDVFKLLKLHADTGDEILKNPLLNLWFSYVEKLKQDPNELLYMKLKTQVGDAGFVKALVAARRDLSAQGLFDALRKAQLNNWVRAGSSVDDIYNLLKLNKEGDKIFESPMFGTWTSYAMKLDKANADELLFSVMKKHYSAESLENMIIQAKDRVTTKNIASKLEEELWRNQGKTADDVFDILKLEKKVDGIFEDPALTTWISYVNKLNKHKETPEKFAVISELEEHFQRMDLARMLYDAKREAKTRDVKQLVSDLQDEQFEKWMVEDLNPIIIGVLVESTDRKHPSNLGVTLDYHNFVSARTKSE
ncbi:hypothetical protein F444_03026 [Phytophthora nicotianae P1976]|uniref:RxLR effector protein n=1 Tax=Phytophthora nicotianae P1976 TaxID=1317066 RepID=A0A081AVH3_PHYNI|nr:hypothetical protein F444_03026 [Phytophthora nicotianae P1976]